MQRFMTKKFQTKFSTRQHMLSKDFEIYYYNGHYKYSLENHTHNYYELYFFLEGDVSIEIDGKIYPLRHGDIVLILPGKMHHAVIHNKDKPYCRFVFWISLEYYSHILEYSQSYGYIMQYAIETGNYIFHNDRIAFNTIQAKVFQLIEEIHMDRFGKEARLPLCVNELLLHINRIVYSQVNPGKPEYEQDLYENIMHYIDRNLEGELTLDRLAKEFFVSKHYITHIFKKNTGISVHQYITKKRIAACREAMLHHCKITEAYLLYGFNDYSSFYRAFKKEYGMPPKEYVELERIEMEKLRQLT